TTGKVLNDNFFRPYQGYGSIQYLLFDGTSTYHSMQTQVTHRFSHGFQFGVAWTWSKAMDFTDGDQGTVASHVSPNIWNWGLAAYDRTHVVAINYVMNLPGIARLTHNAAMEGIFGGWQLAGTTRFVSGAPLFWNNGDSDSSFGTG